MRKSQYKNYLVFVICFINIYSSSNLIAQRIYTVAGGSLGDNLPASQVGLTVWSIAVDEDGNIYVADSGNGRVRKIDSSTGLIGGFDGPGRTVLAMDKLGYLYMSDYYENTIKKFDLTSGELLIIAGNGTEGYSGDGSLALNAQLSKPTGIAIDKDGNVYISDTGNSRIRRVDGITQIITTIAGTGSSGFSGDGNLAINAQFNEPEGLAADSQGNIYIADKYNNRIRKVSISSGLISTVAGNGSVFPYLNDELAINTNLSNPSCIAVDIEDNLYIADFWHSCVFKVFSSNGRIALVAGNGTYGISGDGGLAVNASLLTPNSLGFDKFGNIYFGDLSTVRKVEVSSGLITTITGNGSHSYCCDGGPAIEAQFSVLNGIAIDDHGNIYIADTDNFRVRKVDENGIITTFAGIGQLGFGDEENGGLAINAKLSPPIGITTDHVGNVYISEAFRIRKVDVTTGIITTFAGTGVSGFSGDGGLAINAKINAQAGIEFDS